MVLATATGECIHAGGGGRRHGGSTWSNARGGELVPWDAPFLRTFQNAFGFRGRLIRLWTIALELTFVGPVLPIGLEHSFSSVRGRR